MDVNDDSFNFGDWNCYNFYEKNMRDEKEKRILTAVKEDDVQGLKVELENPVGFRLCPDDIPILSVAALKAAKNVIKFLIDCGCDSNEVDNHGSTALHLIVSEYSSIEDMRNEGCACDGDGIMCAMCKKKLREIVEIFLAASTDAVDSVFFKIDKMGMTPFLLACHMGYDEIILRFLTLLDNNSISVPMDRFIGFQGDNLFNFLLDSPFEKIPPERDDTVAALFDRFPFAKQLIDGEDENGKSDTSPLHQFLSVLHYHSDTSKPWRMVELTKICLKNGASPDVVDERGMSYFNHVVSNGNVELAELFLRAGCRIDVDFFGPSGSPLGYLLSCKKGVPKPELVRMIELLLAFGYDLQKELFLYTIDELPIELETTWHTGNRDPTDIDPDILTALREIRRSQVLFSLQRQCRNLIRRNLKGKADEIIPTLDGIPNLIKSYLMVENEKQLLDFSN